MGRFKAAHRSAPRGTLLLRTGDAGGQQPFTLFSGWAFRYQRLPDGRRQILGVLLPGDSIGLELLLAQPLGYSVRAASDVAYCALDVRLSSELLSLQPQLRERVVSLLLRQSRLSDEWLTCIGRCNAEERIASLLIDLYERLSSLHLVKDRVFSLRLTQQELADALGLNIVHLNRVLRRLRQRNLVTVADHETIIHDLVALRGLAPLHGVKSERQRPLI